MSHDIIRVILNLSAKHIVMNVFYYTIDLMEHSFSKNEWTNRNNNVLHYYYQRKQMMMKKIHQREREWKIFSYEKETKPTNQPQQMTTNSWKDVSWNDAEPIERRIKSTN